MNTLMKKAAVIGGSVALVGASIWGMSAAVNSIDQTPNISTASAVPDGGIVFDAPRDAPSADPTPTVEPTTVPEPTVEPVAPAPPAPAPAPAPVKPAPAPAPIKCPAGTKAGFIDGATGNESNCEPLNPEGQSCQMYDENNVCLNWYKP